MTSGIYRLTFSSGRYYIGKSNNIERRFDEHKTSFAKGKAAASMQYEYNKYGYPAIDILLRCHQDHIDIMEALLINKYWINGIILNSIRPQTITQQEFDYITEKPLLLEYSTPVHCKIINDYAAQIDKLSAEIVKKHTTYKAELKAIKNGTKLEQVEYDKEYYQTEARNYKNEIYYLKSRNWYQRLFNL